MNKNQNDLSAVTRNSLYNSNNYRELGPQNFMPKKPCNPYDLPMLHNKTYSFIVEWQLPKMEDHDAENPALNKVKNDDWF